jgi:hypothetical protein
LSTKVQACHNLFDIDILVQDMTFTATKMTDTREKEVYFEAAY